MSEIFRPSFGRALTVFIGGLCAVSAIAIFVSGGIGDGLRGVPWLALVAGSCWAAFWRPAVVVDDSGVTLINVTRTIHVPWPAIVMVDTKWALTLITEYGKYTAWAAPAPGMHTAVRATRRELRRVPDSVYTAEGIRPGDLPSTESGGAALLIRARWEKLREAGHLDAPKLEHETAPVAWHARSIAIGTSLLVVAIVGLIV